MQYSVANDGRNRPAQRAHSSNQVSFGHFGTATYNEQSRSWTFLRQPAPKIRSQDGSGSILPPFSLLRDPVRIFEVRANSNSYGNTSGKTSISKLLKTVAETAPVVVQADVRPHMNRLQQSNNRKSRSILAFGSAMVLGDDDAPSGFAALPIAVSVKPNEPDRLILTLLGHEIVQTYLDPDELSDVRFPIIGDQESTSWSSHGDPIEDVHFSIRLPLQRGTWLAIRRAHFINIFRPSYHRVEAFSHHGTGTVSSLDPNMIAEISSVYTGNQALADVAFDPQKPGSFVIVDIAGNWSVWKLRGTRARSARVLYRVQLVVSGHISPQPDSLVQFDGWHRIGWLRSGGEAIDRFFVCNRQSISLFDIRGNKLSEVDLQVGYRFEGSILDFVTAPTYNVVFILTESRVFVVSATGSDSPLIEDHNGLAVSAYWNHFQGSANKTLEIHAVQSSHSVWLFLTSTTSPILVAYECVNTQESDSTSFSISDPIWTNLSFLISNNPRVLSFQAVAAESVKPKERVALSFFKVFVQTTNGDIFDTLYQLVDPTSKGQQSEDEVVIPNRQLLHHKSASHIRPLVDNGGLGDFIVADCRNDHDHPDSVEHSILNDTHLELQQAIPDNNESVSRVLPCDFQRTYDTMMFHIQPPQEGDRDTFKSTFQEIQRYLEQVPAHTPLCSKLVWELPVSTPYVAEIEDDSQTLESWFYSYAYVEQGIDIQRNRGLRTSGKSLLEVYNDMTEIWIAPLPAGIPSRLRVQRERLLRQIALEVLLSSVTLKSLPPSHDIVHESGRGDEDDDNLPESSVSAALNPLLQDDFASEGPFPSSPPSGSTQTEAEPTKTSRSVLSQYVRFTQPATTDSKSSVFVNNILSHLPVSTQEDPVSYNYDNAELNLALARNEFMNQNLGAKSRRKVERLSRTHRKNLERQAEFKRVALEQSTAIPSIMSSQLPIRNVQSSQIGVPSSSQSRQDSGLQMLTQPERGIYGRRDDKTKPKGKVSRRKGF